MDDSYFRIIDPTQMGSQALRAHTWPEGTYELAADAESMVRGAASLFFGIYPIEAPYLPWGDSLDLPWLKKSLKTAVLDDNEWMTEWAIGEGVRSIAAELTTFRAAAAGWPEQPQTLQRPDVGRGQETIQGLAVEVMLAADATLWALLNADFAAAARHLSFAYKCLIECTVEAQLTLGISSLKARAGADAIHGEHRQWKKEVFDWLDANHHHHKKVEQKFEAVIAAKLNVAARTTVRGWVTAWNKSRSKKGKVEPTA